MTLTVGATPSIVSLSGPIILDRAGMWIFGDDPHTIDGNDSTTFEAFFWVNTSKSLKLIPLVILNMVQTLQKLLLLNKREKLLIKQ